MRRTMCFLVGVGMLWQVALAETVNVNTPTANKNWFSEYKEVYTPASDRPALAAPAIGMKSMSANSYYDYKQTSASLKMQSENFYVNSFKEIFKSGDNRVLSGLVSELDSSERKSTGTDTGNFALDSYEASPYEGLSEEDMKWLVNNNIVSRDLKELSITPDEIKINGGSVSTDDTDPPPFIPLDPLLVEGKTELLRKSDFLMALHKGTYGVIESRPLVFNIAPYRWASKITWVRSQLEPGGSYRMSVGDELYQKVNTGKKDESDRGEYRTRLEGDTNYVVATFPDYDKLFITSPNVMELYIKSLLDKGIINSKNLLDNTSSKNVLRDGGKLSEVFNAYGVIDDVKKQSYPLYAPELGPLESVGDKVRNHTYFEVDLVGDLKPWGRRYNINMTNGEGTINLSPAGENADFFVHEDMLTMEALKFIEAILRVREGDMTSTEAMIVSYKYGVNFIDSLQGSDRSTAMYLTAMGILNFENFDEYASLYAPLDKTFGYTLLYRVANPAARKKFTEIQLTDSDNFWIERGFGSYDKVVRVPDTSKLQSYVDSDGQITANPERTNNSLVDKNVLSLMPHVETRMVCMAEQRQYTEFEVIAAEERVSELAAEVSKNGLTSAISEEYSRLKQVVASSDKLTFDTRDTTYLPGGIPVLHKPELDIHAISGEDLYADKDFLNRNEAGGINVLSGISGKTPFNSGVSAKAVDDTKAQDYAVEKLFDDPYKYLFDKLPIVKGEIPATREERASWDLELHDDASEMIKSIKYDKESDSYSVTFLVTAIGPTAALQVIDSKLRTTTDSLMRNYDVGVVSKITTNGQLVTLVSRDSLPLIDPDLVVISDKVLLNRRTGTKAVLLSEQNVALVGNHIIETVEGALMVEAANNQVYYNLDIISSLLSNTYMSKIGEGDFYALADVQAEQYLPVYTSRGDEVATSIVGTFAHLIETEANADITPRPMEEIVRDYANVSQLMTGSGILIKDFVRETESGFPVEFTVVVEWKLTLPDSTENLTTVVSQADINPTIGDINRFYSSRPPDTMPDLQEFWDNNIVISNALANAMYSTNKANYITSGYLVPHIAFLFNLDTPDTVGGSDDILDIGEESETVTSNLITDEYVQSIAGAWFQEVGKEIPDTWVSRFFGTPAVYNKILRNDDNSANQPDFYKRYGDAIRLVDEDGVVYPASAYKAGGVKDGETPVQYRLTSNEGSIFFTDKSINFNWFPAWVHVAFNNQFVEGVTAYPAGDAANGRMWRKLAGDRTFGYYPRKERRSYGTVYGTTNRDYATWIKLPSGAVYKSMISGVRYRKSGNGVVVDTRTKTTDYGLLVGKTLEYDGAKYYVSRFDKQYLELISLDAVEGVVRNGQFVNGNNPLQKVGYSTIRERFTTKQGSATFSSRKDTVDVYQDTSNMLPASFYSADIPFLITDAAGGVSVRKFSTIFDGNENILSTSSLSPHEYSNSVIHYHPVVRLSVVGWDVTGVRGRTLVHRRTAPALLFNDMYESSLTKTVVDTMIARSVGSTKLEEVPVGSIVLFGDIYTYKTKEGFITSPVRITSTESMPVIKDGIVSQAELSKQVSSLFSMVVDTNGRTETVANYINKTTLAPPIKNDRFLYNNTMVANSRNPLEPFLVVEGDTVESVNEVSRISSVSYFIELAEGLVCMPVSTDNKVYTVLFTAEDSGVGSLVDVPYFTEDLNFFVRDRVKLDTFATNFYPLPNQHELKQEFLEKDKEQTARDILTWVQTALSFILAYLMVMCTMLAYTLRSTPLGTLFQNVKYPVNGGRGPDIAKWLTFGVIDIDTEISGGRLFLSMFMLCILFVLIIVGPGWVEQLWSE